MKMIMGLVHPKSIIFSLEFVFIRASATKKLSWTFQV